MAKMTKTQMKRALGTIIGKAGRMSPIAGHFSQEHPLTTQDFLAIQKICDRAMKRLK
jgi:hypothetical protein